MIFHIMLLVPTSNIAKSGPTWARFWKFPANTDGHGQGKKRPCSILIHTNVFVKYSDPSWPVKIVCSHIRIDN